MSTEAELAAKNVTPIQQRTLFFIEFFSSYRGYSPTVREVGEAIGRSVGQTHFILSALRKQGRVAWEPEKVRTLRVAS